MQVGFAFLEAGSLREKSLSHIIVKNIIDCGKVFLSCTKHDSADSNYLHVAFGTVAFWATGFAFAGGDRNAFIGTSGFFLSETEASEFPGFFGALVFAATCATIVSGAIAERTQLVSYIIFTVVMTGFIYPLPVHWAYSDAGWLNKLGFIVGISYFLNKNYTFSNF